MANNLPYFKWFPADAEMDEAYSLLTDEECGFFHRCLNRSWINRGLPEDTGDIARMMRRDRELFDRLWSRIGKLFVLKDARHVNPRQEIERNGAIAKGKSMKRPGNANAKKRRSRENADETQLRSDGVSSANNLRNSASLRASGSDSDSESSPKKKTESGEIADVAAQIAARHPGPHGCSPALVAKQLTKITARMSKAAKSAKLQEINANHAAWCATEQWQKDGGKWANGLHNWLSLKERLFEEKPVTASTAAPAPSQGTLYTHYDPDKDPEWIARLAKIERERQEEAAAQ